MGYWAGALALALATTICGCAIFDETLNNRGGYADHLADKFWMRADSKQLRVLRAYALQAAVGRVAAISPANSKERDIVAVRMARANAGFERAVKCAYQSVRGCIYFDDAMVEWTNAIFNLAMSALSAEDGRRFVTRVTSGGVDTLEALFELGKDAFVMGRAIGAIYRDTIELEVVVWIDDKTISARTGKLLDVYANGAGDLRQWKAELERLKNETGPLPLPQREHFVQIREVVVNSCDAITSDTTLRTTCKGSDVSTKVLKIVADRS